MYRTRVIPVLLLKNGGMVKTRKFREPVYLGDPINIVKIFNDKETDELVLLDISATPDRRPPNIQALEQIATECFMPLCYGGGVSKIEEMRELFQAGFEKVAINSAASERPALVREAADAFGSQSVVVSIDVARNWIGRYEVRTHGNTMRSGREPVEYATEMEHLGAGEILLTSIDRDGTYKGFDLELVSRVTAAVTIPVVACGGASGIEDLVAVVRKAGASAAGASSIFVFHGSHRAVLISYPPQSLLAQVFR